MDRLEAMSILIAAVETGSFSAASRNLGVPLPTVSRKIAELEAHLNTRLLVRTTRKLALTDAGVAYLAASKNILEQVGDAERAASGEYVTPKGDLVVAAPIVFGRLHVLPVVTDFLATFPDIRVRMLFSDRNTHLVDDHIDMAVRIGALPDSSMMATRIGSVRRVVCGSPAYFAEHGTPKTPADLTGHACITFDVLAAGTAWIFASPDKKSDQGGTGFLPALGQHRGSRHRCGNRRRRHHSRAVISGRSRCEGREAQDRADGIRTRTHTRQPDPCGPGIAAAQDAKLP
jgi:DNA-binding transcriptional LysR family regulator